MLRAAFVPALSPNRKALSAAPVRCASHRPRTQYARARFVLCAAPPQSDGRGHAQLNGDNSSSHTALEANKTQGYEVTTPAVVDEAGNGSTRPPPPNGGGEGSESGDDGGSPRDDSGPTTAATQRHGTDAAARKEAISDILDDLGSRARMLPGRLGEVVYSILQTVPAPVLVALITITSTFLGTRANERNEQRKREEEAKGQLQRTRADAVAEVRSKYQSIESCLLKTTLLLAQHLAVIANGDVAPHGDDDDTYSAFLLVRYFGSVELLKKQTHLLDLGFPATDRIFANIVGRVQGVMAADDAALNTVQRSERFFRPPPGTKPYGGGPLRVSPRAQAAAGELMLRSHWRRKGTNVGGTSDDAPSMNSMLTYVEFCELLDSQEVMQRWVEPIKASFREARSRRSRTSGPSAVGARIYVAQSALFDLVDFLDPGPRPRHVPLDNRMRLQIGLARYEEEQPPPPTVRALYHAMSALRDGVGARGIIDMTERLRGRPIEVYVKSAEGAPEELGDCPFASRVLLTLEELGIRYRAIRISHDDKPSWFHLIHAPMRTPVIYHDGHLIAESSAICDYLEDRFRSKRLSKSVLPLDYGEERMTRFHGAFIEMLCGAKEARKVVDAEIRRIDRILRRVAARNADDAPLFGGASMAKQDIALAPFLYHACVAGGELDAWSVPKDCSAVLRYMERARQCETFQKSTPDVPAIVAGYGRLVKEGRDRKVDLKVSLE